ncbi:MAG: dTMP kinase [Candidatus Kryptoniota bacterium]
MLIAFEGIDGSGKTTQAELLMANLQTIGMDPVLLREPGATPLGEKIRDILLHGNDLNIMPVTEFLLFSASRSQLVYEKLNELLHAGRVVILDRYFYSSIAYQGFGRGIAINEIENISRFATNGILPDIIFLLDLDIALASERLIKSGKFIDRMEKAEKDFYRKVLQGFRYCAEKDAGRFVVVDANADRDSIARDIFKEVLRRMKKND